MGATGFTGGDPNKVDIAGDTMTGPLILSGDPSVALGAATKQYAESQGGGGGGSGTPSGTVVSETSYGQTATAGAATAYSRGDHSHGTPALPSPAAIGAATTGHTHTGIYDPAGSSAAALSSALSADIPLGATTPNAVTIAGTSSVGVATSSAHADHTHGGPGFGTVVTETTFGQSATSGVASTVARSDHSHGTPTAPTVPSASGTVVSETTFGASATAGVATSYSRGDHTHGTPAAQTIPSAGGTVVTETTFGQSSTAGAAATFSRSDHTHGTPAAPSIPSAGTTVVAETTFGAVTGAGVASTYSRSDHTHGSPTQPAETVMFAFTGIAVVTTGVLRWYNRTGRTLTIIGCWVAANTAPTGAALTVDVNKNGTTIYTTQGNRPNVAVSTNGGVMATPDVTSVADGDYLTADVDIIGSTIAGANVTVGVVYR